MLNTLPPPVLLDIAIFFTALSWALGFYAVNKKWYIFESLAIGAFVCLMGYSVQSLGAPAWVVMAAPLPIDILLLWWVLRNARKMFIAYPIIWVAYVGIHVLLSSLLRYDSLIPPWKLHS